MPTDTRKVQIERINEISQLARTAWFSLLAYLVFVGITFLGVEDADFFLLSRQTRLPLVGVDIPTASFFWTAPILGAALYTYLHLFLIKLWDAHADARSTDADPTHHWLVNDFVLIRRRDPVARARPLAWLTDWITRFLVWAAGPIVLAYAWWRSMPAHNEWMTLLIALCLFATLYVGFVSWWRAVRCLAGPRHRFWGAWWRRSAAVIVFLLLLVISWLRTEGGLNYYFDWGPTLADVTSTVRASIAGRPGTPVFHWWLRHDSIFSLVRANLSGAELVPVPDDWRTPETARRAFRETWCRREGLAMEICDQPVGPDHPIPAYVAAVRQEWCSKHGSLDRGACANRFTELDRQFATAWAEERRIVPPSLNLQGRDLRLADVRGASLIGADLGEARLEGAVLYRAQLEGADLRYARLEGADLRYARLEGADLRGARLVGTDLRFADFRNSDWDVSSVIRSLSPFFGASPAQFADFRGAKNLAQAQLDLLIGNASTLLPDGLSETGEPWYIWSCWEKPPEGFDALIQRIQRPNSNGREIGSADILAKFLCGPDNPRHKTGTPLALDAPYPQNHPRSAYRSD